MKVTPTNATTKDRYTTHQDMTVATIDATSKTNDKWKTNKLQRHDTVTSKNATLKDMHY